MNLWIPVMVLVQAANSPPERLSALVLDLVPLWVVDVPVRD